MGERLRTELQRRGFRLRDPVGNFALLGLIQQAPFALPAAYLDLLRASNGGAGSALGRGFYLIPAEQVLTEHRGWGVDEHAPDQLLFATDGQGSFYLLDETGRVRACRSADVPTPALRTVAFGSLEELLAELSAPPPVED